MIRVVVLKEEMPYSEDYLAYLLGWVVCEGRVMAMCAERSGDMPYMIHQSREGCDLPHTGIRNETP